ncbi:MAG: hypothetical protein CVT70_14980 [Alphaproteobacteria bacterium HGW-Alphaproteobacteria-1]|nr:MAG: hypothetical protein CVT70_14980 [Alphaproteobacteria bacterium HGW-Alphaproteobacteria-1]
MDRSFGDMAGLAGAGVSGRGRSYFLHDLLRKVIFAEAGWVSQDARAVRRERALRYGVFALVLIAGGALAALWGTSFYRNYKLVRDAEAEMNRYRAEARLELEATEIADPDLGPVLPLLRTLATLPLGHAAQDIGGGLLEGAGLSQRSAIRAATRAAYRDGLERHLRPRLILHVETRIAEDITNNDLLSLYESLKVYKLLGHAAPAPDDAFITAWFADEWARDPAYRGAGPMRELRAEMEAHLWAMLEMSATQSRARVDLNGALVERAERILSLMNLEDQAWLLVMGAGGPQDIAPFNLRAPRRRMSRASCSGSVRRS